MGCGQVATPRLATEGLHQPAAPARPPQTTGDHQAYTEYTQGGNSLRPWAAGRANRLIIATGSNRGAPGQQGTNRRQRGSHPAAEHPSSQAEGEHRSPTASERSFGIELPVVERGRIPELRPPSDGHSCGSARSSSDEILPPPGEGCSQPDHLPAPSSVPRPLFTRPVRAGRVGTGGAMQR